MENGGITQKMLININFKLLDEYSSQGRIFNSIIKSKNVMTPNILGYISIPNGIVELSEGDFMKSKVFGVTVIKNNIHRSDLSKPFNDIDCAIIYIKTLLNEKFSL